MQNTRAENSERFMKKNYRCRIIFSCLSLILFFVACWIYVSNRSTDMVIYDWLSIDVNNQLFCFFRNTEIEFPDWVLYNLPDALWLLSFLFMNEAVWGEDNRKYIFVAVVTIFALGGEILQMYTLFPGTGDMLDIISYVIVLIIYLINNFLINCYEKFSKN